jgi:DNA-repair protein XRCC3
MAPFAERDGDLANAWMEGLGDVIVPREPLLPLSRSVNSKLTTLCPRLDAWLRGGVPTRSVTEIVGEAGSAKTQLALQLLIAAQLPRAMGGLDGAAVYVHTEGRAPLSRLKQLVASHPAVRAFVETKTKTKTKTEQKPEHDFLRGVYVVETLDDPDGLWTALASIASVLGGNKQRQRHVSSVERPVRLIVVDSVSSPFRESDATIKNGAVRRAHALSRVAALLREYAHRHDIAVVVTNHVVDFVTNDDTVTSYVHRNEKRQKLFGPMSDVFSSGRFVKPALGLFWANCVNTRLFLQRSGSSVSGFGVGEGVGGGGVIGGVTRSASVVFSSHLPHSAGRRRRRRADDIRRAQRRRVRRRRRRRTTSDDDDDDEWSDVATVDCCCGGSSAPLRWTASIVY